MQQVLMAGVLNLPTVCGNDVEALNAERRDRMFRLDYDGPFRLGFCVVITLPSAPGGEWGGVAGIRKLFDKKAFDRMEAEEQRRVIGCARNFFAKGGAVVTFQKNAWNVLKSENDPDYAVEKVRTNELSGWLKGDATIPDVCAPPTRLSTPYSFWGNGSAFAIKIYRPSRRRQRQIYIVTSIKINPMLYKFISRY